MEEKTKFEEMMDRLPSNIKESKVLRFQSKKVLAALLELYLHSKARETRLVIVGNRQLRRLSGIKSNDLTSALNQLEDYNLIARKVGKKGKDGVASEYIIHFKNLIKPLKEKTFEDLFRVELDDAESSETSMGTTTTITTSTTITTTTTTPITTATTTTTPISTATTTTASISTATTTTTPTSTTTTTATTTAKEVDSNKDVEEKVFDSFFGGCVLDPKDYEEDNSFLEDLNKRIAYARWGNEEGDD